MVKLPFAEVIGIFWVSLAITFVLAILAVGGMMIEMLRGKQKAMFKRGIKIILNLSPSFFLLFFSIGCGIKSNWKFLGRLSPLLSILAVLVIFSTLANFLKRKK